MCCNLAPPPSAVPPSNVTIVPGNTVFNLSWEPGERDRNHGFHIQYSALKGSGKRRGSGRGRHRGAIRGAFTSVCASSAVEGSWEESEVVNSTQGFYSLTGLLPGTKYCLRILHENNTHWERVIQTVGPGTKNAPVSWIRFVPETHELMAALKLLTR